MSNKELRGDGARESKTKVHGTGKVAKDSLSLLPMASCRRGHMTVEMADNGGDVWSSHGGTVEKLANE